VQIAQHYQVQAAVGFWQNHQTNRLIQKVLTRLDAKDKAHILRHGEQAETADYGYQAT
jgi:hypothetical protein